MGCLSEHWFRRIVMTYILLLRKPCLIEVLLHAGTQNNLDTIGVDGMSTETKKFINFPRYIYKQ